MSVGWCVFDKKSVCPGGLSMGTGVCEALKEEDPTLWKSCLWFLETHPKKKREALQTIEDLSEEELDARVRKRWTKIEELKKKGLL